MAMHIHSRKASPSAGKHGSAFACATTQAAAASQHRRSTNNTASLQQSSPHAPLRIAPSPFDG